MATVTKGKVLRRDLNFWDGVSKTATRVDSTGGTITSVTIGDAVDVLQVYGSGTDYTLATINTAVSAVGSNSVSLLFTTGTWTITDNLTIPLNITCIVPDGTTFSISSGKTLTINGYVYSEAETFSSGAGTLTLSKEKINPTFSRITSTETSGSVSLTSPEYDPGDLRRYLPVGYVTDGSVDYATQISYAFASGEDVIFPPEGGTYQSSTVQTMTANTSLDLNGCTLKFTMSGTVEGLQLRNNVDVYNGTIDVTGTSASGAGNFQCPIVCGDYSGGTGYSNIVLKDLTIQSNRTNGNGIMITGSSYNIHIKRVKFPASTTLGRDILVHWGNATGAAGGTQSDHPYNIFIDDIDAQDQTGQPDADGAVIFVSGAYNVKINNVNAHNINTGFIAYAGDYGDQYAVAAQTNHVGYGITIENVTLTEVAYRGIKIDGAPSVSGSNLAFPVHFKNFTAFGASGGSDSGAVVSSCDGPVFENVRLSGFTFHGLNAAQAAHNGTVIGCRFDNNGYNGIRISNSTTNPAGWNVDNCYLYQNNDNANAGASDKGAITLTECANIKIKNCRFGTTSETQFYSVRTDSTATDIHLENNITDVLAASGVAYSIGSSTDYGIGATGQNNKAASGITLYGGVPLYTITSAGNKEFFASAAPASGTWAVGDKVWNTAPTASTATDMGWACTTAGTPGTWSAFGDIA